MSLNLALRDEHSEVHDTIASDGFIIGLDWEDFHRLTISKYQEMFRKPEMFIKFIMNTMVLPMLDEMVAEFATERMQPRESVNLDLI